jgi:Ca2+-binding RTX toxin-like protein
MATFTGTANPDNLVGGAESDILNGLAGNDNLTGGLGNDTLDGGSGADKYYYQRGDGQDILSDTGSDANSIDQLIILGVGLTSANVIVTRLGTSNDLKISFRDNFTNSIVLKNQVASFFSGAAGVERITFSDNVSWTEEQLWTSYLVAAAASNDRLEGTDLGNTLIGGLGNDYLDGRNGADIYQFRLGDGQDIINDTSTDNSIDQLVFSGNGLTSRNAIVTRVSDSKDLKITFKGGIVDLSTRLLADISSNSNAVDKLLNRTKESRSSTGKNLDSVILKDQVYAVTGGYYSQAGVESIKFSDNVVWTEEQLWNAYLTTGAESNDRLEGTNLPNTLIGGLGSDYLNGRDGGDTYLFRLGDGQDTLADTSTDESIDELVFSGAGLTAANAIVTRLENTKSLNISFGNGILDSVVLTDQVYAVTGAYYSQVGVESIKFSDNVVWTEEQLWNAYLTTGAESNDRLEGTNLSNTLIGGLGSDYLDGRNGGDTYLFRLGDGQDTLADTGTDESIDELVFSGAGLTAANAIVTRLENTKSLNISFGNGILDSVVLTDQVYAVTGAYYSQVGVESIKFSDNVVWTEEQLWNAYLTTGALSNDRLEGTNLSNTLVGGVGNDYLDGRGDADIYRFNLGDGKDTLADTGLDTGIDQLIFAGAGLTSSNVIVSRLPSSNYDLQISFGNGVFESVLLKDQTYGSISSYYANLGIERITFSDGVIWNESQLLAAVR